MTRRWPSCLALVALAAAPSAQAQDSEPVMADEGGGDEATAAPASSNQDRPDRVTVPMEVPQPFSRVGYEAGLPSMQITGFAQDKTGYVWVGTYSGLARMEGEKARPFLHDPKNEATISSSFVISMASTEDGKIWVGTDAGLDVIEDGVVKRAVPGIVPLKLHASGDKLLIGTYAGELLTMDPASLQLTQIELPGMAGQVNAIGSGKSGVWVGTSESGLYHLAPDLSVKKIYSARAGFPSDSITAIVVSDEAVFVGTADAGAVRLDPASGKTKRYQYSRSDRNSIIDDHVTSMIAGADGRIWMGTESGLAVLDPKTGKFVRYYAEEANPRALPGPNITAAFYDRAGVLWFGTFGLGIAKYDPLRARFRVYSRTFTGGAGKHTDKDGTLWVGSYPGLVSHWDFEKQQTTVYNRIGTGDSSLDLFPFWVASIQRADDALWIAAKGAGLLRWVPETNDLEIYGADSPLGSATPALISPSRKGGFYITTADNGIHYLDPKARTFKRIDGVLKRTDNQAYAAIEDVRDANVVWIGTPEGLARVDTSAGTGKLFQHDPDDDTTISSNAVVALYQEPGGHVWAGTAESGANRVDPSTGKAKRITTKDGLRNNGIGGILGDEERGAVWLGTSYGGVARYDLKTETITAYTEKDGAIPQIAQGSDHESPDGKMMFGASSGWMIFDPAEITSDTFAGPVVFTGLQVMGEDEPLAANLDLGYRQTSVTFRFAALSYAAPELNRYQVKLEGFDEEWKEVSEGFANYTNLDPGDYVFKVKAANRHGVWNEEAASMAISVASPPWFSWYAYLAYALILAAAGFAYWRYQQQKLEKVKTEQRLATVEKDLALTAAVQNGFIPPGTTHTCGTIRLQGFWRAAEACSGDWWVYEENAFGKLVVVVADVTGHGAGPAMVTAAAATAFRVARSLPLDQRLNVLNDEVLAVAKSEYQMTVAAVEFDPQTGHYRHFSAGAPPILQLTQGTRSKLIHARGTPLGIPNFVPAVLEGTLDENQRLLLYTDGIPETPDGDGRMFGMRRFSKLCEGAMEVPLDGAVQTIVAGSDEVRGQRPQDDDWTFVLVERAAS